MKIFPTEIGTISLRQGGMILVCFGIYYFVGVRVGDVLVSLLVVWVFTSGRTPRQAWRALLER